MDTLLAHPHTRRLAYAGIALALLAAIAVELFRGGGWWQLVAFGAAPDVALLLGIGRGLERGRLHPRAVPLYNALHRFWGPLGLAAVVVAAGLPNGYAVGALAWAFHISIDRAVGYGLRTADGYQRA